ncbi:DUF4397 domain-containing protein, partial [Micrococcus endophyticus]
ALELPAATLEAAVSVAGTTDPVIGPADVEVAEGVNTVVYAWGSATDETLALATQTVEGLQSAPENVNAGMAPAAQDDTALYAGAGVAALALL